MSLRADQLQSLRAVAARLDVVESAGSTNADLVRAVVDDPAAWPHLSVVVTDDQRRGRGRLDRTWMSPPGSALAVSVLVRVPGIPPAARGWIPLVAGVAMTDAVAAQLPGDAVSLKWPNDVLVGGAKICGILAEVVPGDPDAVVIGAGVNTCMAVDDLPVPTATSFAALGRACHDDRLLAAYLDALGRLLDGIAEHGGDAEASGLHAAAEARCATLGSTVRVSLPDGSTLDGRAVRLDADGRLVVDGAGVETAVSAGDVVHVRPAG